MVAVVMVAHTVSFRPRLLFLRLLLLELALTTTRCRCRYIIHSKAPFLEVKEAFCRHSSSNDTAIHIQQQQRMVVALA
jgi:hypothetical protein